jgi:DNA-binding NarL/FixJ family response regulator
MDVLYLAASGLCTKEISAHLGCSQQTVAAYWSRVYDKVGYRSHVEVLAQLLSAALHKPV